MTGFQLPPDLMHNRGLIDNPSEYVKEWVRSSMNTLAEESKRS